MMKPSYVLWIGVLLLCACEENKSNEKPSSPRVKKNTKVESPTSNQTFTRGELINISLSASEDSPIDSIQVTVGDKSATYFQTSFDFQIPDRQVGSRRILIKAFCADQSESHFKKVIILPESAPEELTYSVINKIPHDTDDYTQGLMIHDGVLYESNGQRGESTLKKKALATGETQQVVNLASNLFGEGLALYNNQFYQLTWTSGEVLVYDLDFNRTATLTNQGEGWGLTTYEDELIMTDGSEKVYFLDPQSFTVNKELEVYDHEGKVSALNELEMIDGKLYSNIYQEDFIVVIDLETGEVLQKIDFSGLLTSEEASEADVLNGIAIDPDTGKIYVTGKWWPWLFEVALEPKTI